MHATTKRIISSAKTIGTRVFCVLSAWRACHKQRVSRYDNYKITDKMKMKCVAHLAYYIMAAVGVGAEITGDTTSVVSYICCLYLCHVYEPR